MATKSILESNYEFVMACIADGSNLTQIADLLTANGIKISRRGLSYWLSRRKARVDHLLNKFTSADAVQVAAAQEQKTFTAPSTLSAPQTSAASQAMPGVPNLTPKTSLANRLKNQNLQRNNAIDALIQHTNGEKLFGSTHKKTAKTIF